LKPLHILYHLRGKAYSAWLLLAFILICNTFSALGNNTQQHCQPRWIDSLVNAGIRSLDSGNVIAASRYFSIAYRCGMCKDSMLYFAAELYMYSMALDTALTFNWGLEKGGHLPQELYLGQRARIFRLKGWKQQADSILSIVRKKEQYNCSFNVYASRSILSINPITIPPKIDRIFRADEIIDDIGGFEVRNKVTHRNNTRFKQSYYMFNLDNDFKIPTRYSLTDGNDTAMRSVSCYFGIGELPLTPEGMFGHRWALHPDKKIDHYDRLLLSFPFTKKGYISTSHNVKWTKDGICDNQTDLQFSWFTFRRKFSWFKIISAAHHFSRFNQYESQSGSSEIYSRIPLGYIDSLATKDSAESKYLYYRDRNLTQPFHLDTNPIISEYWDKQPLMRLVTQPEHDISAILKSTLQFTLPLKINLGISNYIRCSWYPEKICWFSLDDSITINYLEMYKDYAVVFNSQNGRYYLNRARTESDFHNNSLVELKRHEKTRLDCYLSMTVNIEKEIGRLGELYFITSYVKCFSTLPENSPLISLNQNWELRAGWKKDISKIR
jgi:hypothetical protein